MGISKAAGCAYAATVQKMNSAQTRKTKTKRVNTTYLTLFRSRALLKARGVSFHPYWAANLIAVHGGDRALVDQLAARRDVGEIEANDPAPGLTDEAPAPELNAESEAAPQPEGPTNE